MLAPFTAICVTGASLASGSIPPVQAIGFFLAATVLFALAHVLEPFEHEAELSKEARLALAGVAVHLPVLLLGLGFAGWLRSLEAINPYPVYANWLLVTIAATMLRRRLLHFFLIQAVGWSAFAPVFGPWPSLVALIVTALAYAGFYRQQARSQRELVQFVSKSERVRERAEQILHDYEETGQGWFWETDRKGLIGYISPTVAETLGFRADQLLGKPLARLFDLRETNKEGERTLSFHLSARSPFNELAVRAATYEERWWSVSGRPIYDSFSNFVGFRGSGTDLTEKKRSQETASRLAMYDSLTSLANRLNMAQMLEKILANPNHQQRNCSVFLLDLDRFKQVNDTLGHPAGDALLKQVADRLKAAVGAAGQVGRLGGDEFKVIVHGHRSRDGLGELAQEIIASLSQPYSIDGHRVVIGASVGIAMAPDNGSTSDELIRNADLALYAAKDGGRGRFHFYAQDLHAQAEERRQLEQDLRDALINGGLSLAYQPVVDTITEEIAGFEALLRWNHPKSGPMPPSKFIPIAEDAGLIVAIGEMVIRNACRDLARWPESIRVAVNVSPMQFASPQLPATITNALAQSGVNPGRLELEITESVFLRDDAGTDAMFAALKGLGLRLALDDFGTGYSSLGYLKKAPFDKIKIDQSFVRGATMKGSRNGAIIASITSLAQALGMDTTAEGVETLDELDLVRMYGCSHVQGFIYERPLTVEQATQLLETGLKAVAKGPRSSREHRQRMFRKVVLDHSGQLYDGMIRNISSTGALIEGLWNVPPGTDFKIRFAEGGVVYGITRWCEKDRMGIVFRHQLERDAQGNLIFNPDRL